MSVEVNCVRTVRITKQLPSSVGFVLKSLHFGFNSAAIQSFHPMQHVAFLAFHTFSLSLLYESILNSKH